MKPSIFHLFDSLANADSCLCEVRNDRPGDADFVIDSGLEFPQKLGAAVLALVEAWADHYNVEIEIDEKHDLFKIFVKGEKA